MALEETRVGEDGDRVCSCRLVAPGDLHWLEVSAMTPADGDARLTSAISASV